MIAPAPQEAVRDVRPVVEKRDDGFHVLGSKSQGESTTTNRDQMNGDRLLQASLPDGLSSGGPHDAPHGRPSLASTEVGGNIYALRRVATCLTCCSPYREEIENSFVRGFSPKVILRSLPSDANLTVRNLREHFLRQHLPLENAVIARLVEEERQHRDEVVQTGADSVVRTLGLSCLVRDEVERKLEAGEITASVKDGLAAEALIARYELATRTAVDQDTMIAGVAAFAQAVRDNCTPEQARAIMDSVRANADARAVQQWAGEGDQPDDD